MLSATTMRVITELHADHDVATCPNCKQTYQPSELSYHTEAQIEAGEEIVDWPDPEFWTRCPTCGRDLSEDIEGHVEACEDENFER